MPAHSGRNRLRSFTLRNFIEELNVVGCVSHGMVLRSFTLRNFIEDSVLGRLPWSGQDCEALRFATPLRSNRHRGVIIALGLRSFTLRNFIEERIFRPPACWWSALLRSFTLRNFIEDRRRTGTSSAWPIAKLYASQLH